KQFWRDDDASQPAVRLSVGCLGHKLDTNPMRERRTVVLVDMPSSGNLRRETTQLAAPKGCQEVAEPVVIPDFRVLIVWCGIASLGSQTTGALDDVFPVRNEHPPTARRDYLVAVEREY